ncbi:hypothetical protein Poly41_14450 [Novipirellula artificiosorum]|uniref:Uncharacterized protein n=1 Tax=Novipirellula artificiosorum TaxID=2528016 RepID=A0A5C6DVH8_9BACT|nr:hypothetical protein Poly41_14450 [Novipirellula artificiosorum]
MNCGMLATSMIERIPGGFGDASHPRRLAAFAVAPPYDNSSADNFLPQAPITCWINSSA